MHTNSQVSCWGNNAYGQLGDGTTIDRAAAAYVPGLTEVASSDGHVCALSNGGVLRCWGSNDKGQLGDGTLDDRLTPTMIATIR